MKSLLLMAFITIASSIGSVMGGGFCYVTIETCACDRALGGPGFLTPCGDGTSCPHFIVECEEGTKCGRDEGGKENCEDTGGLFGLCRVYKGVCGGGGLCGYSASVHAVYYQFVHATGDQCP